MNVLHLSTSSGKGGAGIAAYRLHAGLRKLGVRSTMVVGNRRGFDETVLPFKPTPPDPGTPERLRRYVARHVHLFRKILRIHTTRPRPSDLAYYGHLRPAGYEFFWDGRWHGTKELFRFLPPSEIINIHWVSQFLDLPTFFRCAAQRASIVWTLHDMNAFTGGCHYDMGCRRYLERCGKCPQLGSSIENDPSRIAWNMKEKVYGAIQQQSLHLVAPSAWLADLAFNSPLLSRFQVNVIPNGLDVDVFKPRDQTFSREALGLPPGGKILLFAAESLENRRKGFGLLTEVLGLLRNVESLRLVTVGKLTGALQAPGPVIHLGEIDNERCLSLAYSAADLFVIPSLQDNLPNTVLESMACGTPVVGFAVGGIEEMVRTGLTGSLVPSGDIDAMCKVISEIIENETQRQKMAYECRRSALKKYRDESQAKAYTKLYENLLSGGIASNPS